MAGGIDLALAELFSEWRLARSRSLSHPEASLEEMLDYFGQFLSTHKYEPLKVPKTLHNKPFTTYIIKECAEIKPVKSVQNKSARLRQRKTAA